MSNPTSEWARSNAYVRGSDRAVPANAVRLTVAVRTAAVNRFIVSPFEWEARAFRGTPWDKRSREETFGKVLRFLGGIYPRTLSCDATLAAPDCAMRQQF